MKAFEHQGHHIELHFRAQRESKLHDAAVVPGRLDVALNVGAANDIENDVGTAEIAPHHLHEVVGPVVNCTVSAECRAGGDAIRRTVGGDDLCAESLAELDR